MRKFVAENRNAEDLLYIKVAADRHLPPSLFVFSADEIKDSGVVGLHSKVGPYPITQALCLGSPPSHTSLVSGVPTLSHKPCVWGPYPLTQALCLGSLPSHTSLVSGVPTLSHKPCVWGPPSCSCFTLSMADQRSASCLNVLVAALLCSGLVWSALLCSLLCSHTHTHTHIHALLVKCTVAVA
jgi:hypothetical protein